MQDRVSRAGDGSQNDGDAYDILVEVGCGWAWRLEGWGSEELVASGREALSSTTPPPGRIPLSTVVCVAWSVSPSLSSFPYTLIATIPHVLVM